MLTFLIFRRHWPGKTDLTPGNKTDSLPGLTALDAPPTGSSGKSDAGRYPDVNPVMPEIGAVKGDGEGLLVHQHRVQGKENERGKSEDG